MIRTRSSLRISLGGGGGDLQSYYPEHSGFVISVAIDKYVYIAASQAFKPQLSFKYSNLETLEFLDDVEYPIIRGSLKFAKVDPP